MFMYLVSRLLLPVGTRRKFNFNAWQLSGFDGVFPFVFHTVLVLSMSWYVVATSAGSLTDVDTATLRTRMRETFSTAPRAVKLLHLHSILCERACPVVQPRRLAVRHVALRDHVLPPTPERTRGCSLAQPWRSCVRRASLRSPCSLFAHAAA